SDPLKSLGQHGDPIFGQSGKPIATAFHPPLFPAVLALGSKLGLSSYEAHRWIGCAFGGGTVATIGLIARRVASPRVGLLAAAAGGCRAPGGGPARAAFAISPSPSPARRCSWCRGRSGPRSCSTGR